MYTAGLLHSHNLFRWLVLITLILAVVFAIIGWITNKKWSKRDNIIGMLSTLVMDIQLVIGILLYAIFSPITKAAFADFGAAMKNDDLRFYAVEHILLMVIAVIFVHIGRVKSKKATTDWKKHRVATIWYGIALLIILAGIPWERAFL